MSSFLSYAVIMFLAGFGIPVMASLNATLGKWLGSPVAATVVLFATSLVIATLCLFLSGRPSALLGVAGAPRHLFLAGTLTAFYALSITAVAPHFGIGNAVFLVLLGQLVSAAVIDHYGLFGAPPAPLSPARLSGILLMAAGVFLAQRA